MLFRSDCTTDLLRFAEQEKYKSRIVSQTEIEGMLDGHALACSAAAPGTVFLANRMGLFRSDDHGAHWQDVVVPEAENAPALAAQRCISAVVFTGLGMLTAIAFDDELSLQARKIDDIGRDRKLSSKSAPKLAVSQGIPEGPLGVGEFTPQAPRSLCRPAAAAHVASGCHRARRKTLPRKRGREARRESGGRVGAELSLPGGDAVAVAHALGQPHLAPALAAILRPEHLPDP